MTSHDDMDEREKELEGDAAAALGVEPEKVELPGEVTKGVILYETADGSFGIQPLSGGRGMDLDEMAALAQRLVWRVQAQMVATRVAGEMRAAAAEQSKKPTIIRTMPMPNPFKGKT